MARRRPPASVPQPARDRWALACCLVASVVVLPGGLNAFTLPKLAVASLGVALALWGPRRSGFSRPVLVVLAVACVAVVLSVALTDAPYDALVGPAPRYPGLVSLLVYGGLAVAGAQLLGPARGSRTVGWLVPVLVGCAGAVALVSLLEHVGLRPLESDVSRPGSLLGNASDAGQWGVLALGPLLVAARSRVGAAGLVLAGAVVALSGSRAALLGLLAVGVVVVVLARTAWALAVVAVLAGLSLLVPGVAARVSGTSPLAQHTSTGRVLLWHETLGLAGNHPLGVGPGGFLDAIPAEHDLAWAHRVGPAAPPASPESWPLELLAVGGVVLLLAGLSLGALTAQAGWRSRRDPVAVGLTAGLVGYAVALSFAAVSPGPAVLASLYGGAVLSRTGRGRALGWPFAALAVVLGLGAVAEVPLRSAVLAAGRGEVSAGFDTARAMRPWDPAVASYAGHAYAARASGGDVRAAREGLTWLHGTGLQTRVDRATCLEVLGDFSGAERELADVARRDPFNAVVVLRRGVVAAEARRYPVAISLFRRAAELSPGSPEPWQDLGRVYRLMGDDRGAAAAEAQAARRD